ncbi:MAG: hypothetical protein JXP73_10205 [Deltaproteobacteria bacterium]|nr:hypothetical protein [Deltaproteobacteria bacterium]
MSTAASDLETRTEALSEFRQALATYRECRTAFGHWEAEVARMHCYRDSLPEWQKANQERVVAAENLWVSGVAGFFDLLEANSDAQRELLAKQLELAEKSSTAADKVAWWTKALVIATGVLILATVFTGVVGFLNR